jgi:hypothetical protein
MSAEIGSSHSRRASVVSWRNCLSFRASLMFAIQASMFSSMAPSMDLISVFPSFLAF